MKKIKYFILLSFFPSIIWANQNFLIQERKRINAKIGNKSHNRISIRNDLVREVIGDENSYHIIYPAHRNQIFLLPKPQSKKLINLTIITESNITIDLALHINDDEGKIIIIEAKKC